MEIYRVGGYVRDKLLHYPCDETDWVVVGAHPQQLLDQGFKQVGKDFPVFLHPQSGEEYALARTERKTAPGYKGFDFNATPDVTLEDDLFRRDLTINAMAEDQEGKIIDPYGGQKDLENKILRHVSSAFTEDPVRILRLARFAARYHHLGFSVANETIEMMQSMVANGEVDHLVAERVWQELKKALNEKNPHVFFQVLRDCTALERIMPEINNLFGVPQRKDYHPEVDTGVHTLMALQQASILSTDDKVRFATLVHDLGKAETPEDILPRHIGHEKRSLPLVKHFCQRLSVPNEYRDLALIVAEFHTHCHRSKELKPETVHRVLKKTGALKHKGKQVNPLEQFLLCCEADARGRTGLEEKPYPQTQRFRRALKACQTIKNQEIIDEGFEGPALGEEIARRQIEAIRQADQLAEDTLPENQ